MTFAIFLLVTGVCFLLFEALRPRPDVREKDSKEVAAGRTPIIKKVCWGPFPWQYKNVTIGYLINKNLSHRDKERAELNRRVKELE